MPDCPDGDQPYGNKKRTSRLMWPCQMVDTMAKLNCGEPGHVQGSSSANIDLHHFIERDAIIAAVVELRGAGGGMRRHLAGLLERTAVLEVGCDASTATRRPGPPLHHLPGADPVEPLAVELRLPPAVGARLDGLEEGNPPCLG